MLTFLCRGLGPKSKISGSGEVKAVAKLFRDKNAALLASKRASMLDVLPWFHDTQVLLGRVLDFISTMLKEYFMYEICCQLPLHLWSLVWRDRLCWTKPKRPFGTRLRQSQGIYSKVQGVSREEGEIFSPPGRLGKLMWGGGTTGHWRTRT